ncbi:MAG: hypothetical protein RLZZ621_845 [Gemmatimonadota bacterium]
MRIVITTWGSFGDINPCLGMAHAVRARGHDVAMAAPGYYRDVIVSQGFTFHSVGPDADPDVDRALIAKVLHPTRGPEAIYREILVPALRTSFEELCAATDGADLLVSHPASLAAPLVAEVTGIRWRSTVLSPLHFLSAYDPVVPPLGPWMAALPWRWRVALAPLMSRLGRAVTLPWVRGVADVRRSLGLGPGRHAAFDAQHAPGGVLALFSRVFGGPHPDWPTHVTITGQVRHDTSHGAQLSPALTAFLDAGAPPVVFTLGSSAVWQPGRFYEESVEAARQLGVRAVLLAGAEQAPVLARYHSPTVFVTDAAPHTLLFPRAAAVVHQCGMGTLGTALHAAVPQLAVPFANDQPDNASRLERLGVARTVSQGAYRASRVARALRQLLHTPSYRQRAETLAAVIRTEHGAETAADCLERALEV